MSIVEDKGRDIAESVSRDRVIETQVDSLASILLAAVCGGALMVLVNESLRLLSGWYAEQSIVSAQPYLIGLLCLFSALVAILLGQTIRRWRYFDELKRNNMNRIRNLEEKLASSDAASNKTSG